jgi:hypothetical protein
VDFPELHKQMTEFYEKRESGPSIPLYEVVKRRKIIIEILWQFYHELEDEGYEVRKKLQENENALHGIIPVSAQDQRRTTTDLDGPGAA